MYEYYLWFFIMWLLPYSAQINILEKLLPREINIDNIKRFGMSRFRFGRQHEGYRLLSSDDSGFSDAQFELPPPKIPWKAISLAAFLFVVGTVLLVTGSLIVIGHIDTKYSDRLWPMIVLGGIMFLPGAYHLRIAYYAYKEYPGYSYADIPEYE